jgi:phosphatidylserine/phosphatidylglycerophosphate/cardiolipin synthase-like enzyme
MKRYVICGALTFLPSVFSSVLPTTSVLPTALPSVFSSVLTGVLPSTLTGVLPGHLPSILTRTAVFAKDEKINFKDVRATEIDSTNTKPKDLNLKDVRATETKPKEVSFKDTKLTDTQSKENLSCPLPGYDVCFTPGEDCTSKLLGFLSKAQKSILVQAYSFTSEHIAKGLISAQKRGVSVKVILDKSQFNTSQSYARLLQNQGVSVWNDHKAAIAHNKVMIIDNQWVVTGSFNFTKAAQYKNAENLLIIKDLTLAQKYMQNWEARMRVSRPLTGN